MGGVALSEEVKHAIIDKGCRSVMRRNFFRESKSKRRRVEEGMHSKKVVNPNSPPIPMRPYNLRETMPLHARNDGGGDPT